jgi:hypothetical protein
VRAQRHAAHGRHDPNAGDGGVVATPIESATREHRLPVPRTSTRLSVVTGPPVSQTRRSQTGRIQTT